MFEVGESRIELLGSTGPESKIAGFLTRRGSGLHHVAYGVDDVQASLDQLRRRSASSSSTPVLDTAPRAGWWRSSIPRRRAGCSPSCASPTRRTPGRTRERRPRRRTEHSAPRPSWAFRSNPSTSTGRTAAPPPGEYPYTRGIRAEGYRSRLWTMRQYAGFGSAEQTNERFHYLLRAGQSGLSVAFDLPDPDGLRQRRPHGARRGRQGRRGHRLARRHGAAHARHPPGPRDDVDDHQRARSGAAAALRARRRAQGDRRRRRWGGRSRTTSSRSTPREGRTSFPRDRRCASSPTRSRTARSGSRAGTRSASAATTFARQARPHRRRSRSRSATASPTCRRRSTRASTSRTSLRD